MVLKQSIFELLADAVDFLVFGAVLVVVVSLECKFRTTGGTLEIQIKSTFTYV